MTQDILTLLIQDHQAAEALLQRFDDVVPTGRAEYFCEVVHTLVAHEVAEELVVYPAIRQGSEKGEEITEARLTEQAEAEQTLAELEDLDPQSGAFTNKFKKLRDAVLAHAQAEESTAFPLLEQATTTEQRQELGARYQKAKDTAPTHPPDTAPANKIVGPIAAVFDRAAMPFIGSKNDIAQCAISGRTHRDFRDGLTEKHANVGRGDKKWTQKGREDLENEHLIDDASCIRPAAALTPPETVPPLLLFVPD